MSEKEIAVLRIFSRSPFFFCAAARRREETVLHDRLVQCLVELRMEDVPRAIIQEADHVCRFPVDIDTVLDIRLPQIVAPGLLNLTCAGDILRVGPHLAAGVSP